MTRDIRFRGWDGEEKRMWSWRELLNTHPLGCLYSHGDGSWEVMQYTGLCDKNGVEIYEGDIVKAQTGLVGSVHWDGSMLTYRVKWFDVPGSYLYIVHSWCEVIGNIYEHNYLLCGEGEGDA